LKAIEYGTFAGDDIIDLNLMLSI